MSESAKKLATIDEWMSLPDDDRSELIEGELVYKLESAEHGFCQSAVAAALFGFNRPLPSDKGPAGWWIGTEIKVIYEGRPNGFRHDVVGWRRNRHPEKPKGRRVVTKPDWVCEIISTNRGNDIIRKKRALHEHHVEHYWTVDLARDVLTVYRWEERNYIPVLELLKDEGKAEVEPFFGVELEIKTLFGEE